MMQNLKSSQNDCDNYYQISDDDIDDCDDFGEDSLLEEAAPGTGIRGPYERAWTTEATRALIHIRGPMEGRFTEGRQKRTALWLHCTRQLQRLGYRYSAAKVQKKWHNILITYNKNLSKKYIAGQVHWEFFEEMYKYLQGKKANCEVGAAGQLQQQLQQQEEQHQPEVPSCDMATVPNYMLPQTQMQIELKQPKLEIDASLPLDSGSYMHDTLEPSNKTVDSTKLTLNELGEESSREELHSAWWKNYFERKLQAERDKIQLQRDMHRELMQFHSMSLTQQERIERVKIDAINNFTNTLQKLIQTNRKLE